MTGPLRDIEELRRRVGTVGFSDWVEVAPDRTSWYAAAAHHDLVYGDTLAADYPDGLIDGFHLLALLDWLSVGIVGAWHGYNYGLDRVRFPAHVTTHDRLRLRLEVGDAEPRSGGLLMTYDCALEVEGRERPGAVAVWKVLVLPPPAP